jgi:hypothetical protein
MHSAGSNVFAFALTDFRSGYGTRLHAGSLDTIVLAIAVKMAPGYTLACMHARYRRLNRPRWRAVHRLQVSRLVMHVRLIQR